MVYARDLSVGEVLERFRSVGLKRDLLYVWTNRKWVKAKKMRKGKTDIFFYPKSEMQKIARLLWSYSLGFSPDVAQRLAQGPAIIAEEGTEQQPFLEHFHRLLRVCEQLTDAALLVSSKQGLELLCAKAQQLMDSEACSLFLVNDEQYYRNREPEHITLVAYSGDRPSLMAGKQFRLHQQRGAGLTGYLARLKRPIAMCGEELANSPYNSRGKMEHLATGTRNSLLMVPLFDHKKRFRGCIKFENKKGKNGQSRPEDFYDPFEQAIATILANQISYTLQTLDATLAARDLLFQANAQKLPAFLEKLLEHAIRLTGGDYGDVFWCMPGGSMVALAQLGESKVGIGDTPSTPSIAKRVAELLSPILISDVHDEQYKTQYAECRSDVRSEVCVPIVVRGRCVGVLNVEASRPDAFIVRDIDVLRYLADIAAPEIEAVERREEIYARIESILELQDAEVSSDVIIRSILQSVLLSGFDRARVFTWDEARSAFHCCGSLGLSEVEDQYRGEQLLCAESAYARLTVEDAKVARPTPQIRNPKKSGRDPYSKKFSKKDDLPWIVYPLVVKGELFGYIAADNHVTEYPITPMTIENVRLFGVLAAKTLAKAKQAQSPGDKA